MNAENFFVFLVGGCKIYKSENKNKKKHAEQFGLYKMHILCYHALDSSIS